MNSGLAQIAIIEEAVSLADAHHDDDLAFEARQSLVRASTFGGRPDLGIVAYSWMLAKSDEDPERFHDPQLLWRYKWIVDKAAHFPNISRAQIDELFEDMVRRYTADGSTLHAVWSNRRSVALSMGDMEAAARYNEILLKTERDHLSDCHACVQDENVWHHTLLGEDEKAVEAAKPIFKGKLSCSSVPEVTHANILLPLMRLGKHEEAAKHHKTGYRLVAWNPSYLIAQSEHLEFLALTDQFDRALTLLQRHLPLALTASSPRWQFHFYFAVRLLIDRLERVGKASIPLRMPEELKPLAPNGSLAIGEFKIWLNQELMNLANAFDTRNGNDTYSQRVQNIADLQRYARKL